MAEAKPPPWKRRSPGKIRSRKKLTPQQVAAARQRARKAGRRYPNLVDNMWAATLKIGDLTPLARDSDVPGAD